MLILSRKAGESFTVGGWRVAVTVLRVRKDGAVRIGVTADKSIPVLREELQRSMDADAGLERHPDILHPNHEAFRHDRGNGR